MMPRAHEGLRRVRDAQVAPGESVKDWNGGLGRGKRTKIPSKKL